MGSGFQACSRTSARLRGAGFSLWFYALALLSFALTPAVAQEPRSTIVALNKALAAGDKQALSALFTADSDFRIGRRFVANGPEPIAAALLNRSALSEVSPPRITKESVRLLSPDVALADAEQVRYGSMIIKQSTPVILLLKKTAEGWQILSLRLFPDSTR